MLTLLVAIAAYVLGSLGFYTIAKIRHIKHGWLAWVPVGNAWLLGSISDQYQLVKHGKKTYRATILLVLNIILGLSAVAMMVLCVIMIVQLIAADGGAFAGAAAGGYKAQVNELPGEIMGVIIGLVIAYVVMMLSMIPSMIMQYIALYDVFQSCDPNSSVLYLLLSIFLGISSFLVFACRYKDLGMPRKNAPQPSAQAYEPVPAYSQPPKLARPKNVPWEYK